MKPQLLLVILAFAAVGVLLLVFAGDPGATHTPPESSHPDAPGAEPAIPAEPPPAREEAASPATCAVAGVVRDVDTREPIPGATVRLSLANRGGREDASVVAGADGTYRFDEIPAGSFAWPRVERTVKADPEDPWSPGFRCPSRETLVDEGRARVLSVPGEEFRRDLSARRLPWGEQVFLLRFPDGAAVPGRVEFRAPKKPGYAIGAMTAATIDPADPRVAVALAPGRYGFRFAAGMYFGEAPEVLVVGDGELAPIEVSMREQGRVFIQIEDEAGRPLRREGVVVRAVVRGPERADDMGRAVTDEDGRAHVSHLMLDREESDVEGREFHFIQSGAGILEVQFLSPLTNLIIAGREYVTRLAGTGADLVLGMRFYEFFPLRVRVVDREGRPVPGVRFRCEGREDKGEFFLDEEVVSGPEGHLALRLLFVPLPGWSPYATVRAQPPWSGLLDLRTWSDGRFMKGDPPRMPEVAVFKGHRVRFRVTDDAGRPEAGALVVPNHRAENSVRTDDDGRFELPLPVGNLKLPLAVDGIWLGEVEVRDDGTEIPLTLPARWKLELSLVAPSEVSDEGSLGVQWETSVLSGHVRLERIGSGRFEGELTVRGSPVTLTALSHDRRWVAVGEAAAGSGPAVLTFVRRRLHRVTLRFLDADGRPVTGLEVLFRRDMTPDITEFVPASVTTNASGEFELELPAGKYFGPMRLQKPNRLDGFNEILAPSDEVQEFRVRRE